MDYYDNRLTWQPGRNPKQRLTAAIYEVPFGRGRKFMTGANTFVDGVLGGWSISGLYQINTGNFLRFGWLSTVPIPLLQHQPTPNGSTQASLPGFPPSPGATILCNTPTSKGHDTPTPISLWAKFSQSERSAKTLSLSSRWKPTT